MPQEDLAEVKAATFKESTESINRQADMMRRTLIEHEARVAKIDMGKMIELQRENRRLETNLRAAEIQLAVNEKEKELHAESLADARRQVALLTDELGKIPDTVNLLRNQLGESQALNEKYHNDLMEERARSDQITKQLLEEQELHSRAVREANATKKELEAQLEEAYAAHAATENRFKLTSQKLAERTAELKKLQALRKMDLLESNEIANNRVKSAEGEMIAIDTERASLIADMKLLEDRCAAEHVSHLQEMTSLATKHAQEVATLHLLLEDKAKEIGSLRMICDSRSLQEGGSAKSIEGLRSQIIALATELEGERNKYRALVSIVESPDTARADKAVQAAFVSPEDVTQELKRLQSEAREARTELKTSEAQRAELQAKLEAVFGVQGDDLNAIVVAQRELLSLNERLEEAQDELKRAQEKAEEAKGDAAASTRASVQHRELMEIATTELRSKDDLILSLQATVAQLTSQAARLTRSSAEADERAEQAEVELAKVRADCEAETRDARAEVLRFKDELAELFKEYKDKEKEVEAFEREVNELKTQLDSLKAEISTLNAAAAEAQATLNARDAKLINTAENLTKEREQNTEDAQAHADARKALQGALATVNALGISPAVPAQRRVSGSISAFNQRSASPAVAASTGTTVPYLAEKLVEHVRLLVDEYTELQQFCANARDSFRANVTEVIGDDLVRMAVDTAFLQLREDLGDDADLKVLDPKNSNSGQKSEQDVANPSDGTGTADVNAWIPGWSTVALTLRRLVYIVTNHQTQVSKMQTQVLNLRSLLHHKDDQLTLSESKLRRIMHSASVDHPSVSSSSAMHTSQNYSAANTMIDVPFVLEQQPRLLDRLQRSLGSLNHAAGCSARVMDELAKCLRADIGASPQQESRGISPDPEDGDRNSTAPPSRDTGAPQSVAPDGGTDATVTRLADTIHPDVARVCSCIRRTQCAVEWMLANCFERQVNLSASSPLPKVSASTIQQDSDASVVTLGSPAE